LNKNNKYRDQIEFRTLTLTRGTLLGWHVDILKKFKKKFKRNSEKPRSDTWHTPGLTRVHFKKILKKFKKIQKNHEVTRGSHYSWSLMI